MFNRVLPSRWLRTGSLLSRKRMRFVALMGTLVTLLLTSALWWSHAVFAQPAPASNYVDATLGFGLTLPSGWQAHTYRGPKVPATTSAVQLLDPAHPSTRMQVSVMRTGRMASDFARKGTSPTQVGHYRAFVEDTPASAQSPTPCVVRVFLARNDYVIGQLCSATAQAEAPVFISMLATYQPDATQGGTVHVTQAAAARPYNSPASCASLANGAADKPADRSNWGKQLALPGDARWAQSGSS
ncbi:MAG TPA: hypothetical protein VFY89_07595, partial [Ktedonobacterales bacterium]